MSWLTQDGTAEPVSRDKILRPERRRLPCSADHEHAQDWQSYPFDPYSAAAYVMTMHDFLDCGLKIYSRSDRYLYMCRNDDVDYS